MAISETEPVATGKCSYGECGAKINYRVTAGGLVYYTCRGEHELKQCRRYERMGKMESKKFLQKLENMKASAANDNEGTSRSERPAKRKAAANDNEAQKEPETAAGGNSDDWCL